MADRPAAPESPAASTNPLERPAPDSGAREEHRRSSWREIPALVLIALAIALLLRTFVVQVFYIPSPSMEPTLQLGDRVVVNKLATRFGDVHRGDVIVFEDPHPVPEPDRNPVSGFIHWFLQGLGAASPSQKDFIKRVIALPGETWEIRDGVVYVDGRKLDEPYLSPTLETRSFGPETVPEDHLFVLGDNRTQSDDSRFSLGYIPRDMVVGKAFAIIWPPARFGWL